MPAVCHTGPPWLHAVCITAEVNCSWNPSLQPSRDSVSPWLLPAGNKLTTRVSISWNWTPIDSGNKHSLSPGSQGDKREKSLDKGRRSWVLFAGYGFLTTFESDICLCRQSGKYTKDEVKIIAVPKNQIATPLKCGPNNTSCFCSFKCTVPCPASLSSWVQTLVPPKKKNSNKCKITDSAKGGSWPKWGSHLHLRLQRAPSSFREQGRKSWQQNVIITYLVCDLATQQSVWL
jgi:hypothetical protein